MIRYYMRYYIYIYIYIHYIHVIALILCLVASLKTPAEPAGFEFCYGHVDGLGTKVPCYP
jgi:hypothetical protein